MLSFDLLLFDNRKVWVNLGLGFASCIAVTYPGQALDKDTPHL